MTEEQKFALEQRGVAIAMAGAVATSLFVLIFVWVSLPETSPASFAVRLQSAIRIDLWLVAWLAAAIANVARLRFFSQPDIGGSSVAASSETVRRAIAILQNTLEQAILAVGAHLVVTATFDQSIPLVRALAVLFAIGRLLFWIGYRHGARGRAFGFALTFYPSILALIASGTAILLGWAN